jgi:hypothetical protein
MVNKNTTTTEIITIGKKQFKVTSNFVSPETLRERLLKLAEQRALKEMGINIYK